MHRVYEDLLPPAVKIMVLLSQLLPPDSSEAAFASPKGLKDATSLYLTSPRALAEAGESGKRRQRGRWPSCCQNKAKAGRFLRFRR